MLKIFGVGSIIGGLLRVISSFVTVTENPDLVELLYIVTDFGLIIGLVGLYLLHHESLAALGQVGFIIALCALSFIAGPDATIFGLSAYEIGSPIIGVGVLMLAVSLIRSESYGSKGAMVLVGSIVIGGIALLIPSYPVIFALSGALFGLGFVMNGLYVYGKS